MHRKMPKQIKEQKENKHVEETYRLYFSGNTYFQSLKEEKE